MICILYIFVWMKRTQSSKEPCDSTLFLSFLDRLGMKDSRNFSTLRAKACIVDSGEGLYQKVRLPGFVLRNFAGLFGEIGLRDPAV